MKTYFPLCEELGISYVSACPLAKGYLTNRYPVGTVSSYYKSGYDIPFGQLILVEDGIHWARPQHAQLAWDFMKHFRRNENGKIEIITE